MRLEVGDMKMFHTSNGMTDGKRFYCADNLVDITSGFLVDDAFRSEESKKESCVSDVSELFANYCLSFCSRWLLVWNLEDPTTLVPSWSSRFLSCTIVIIRPPI